MRRRLAAFFVALLVVFGLAAVPHAANAEPNFVLSPNGVVGVERSWGLWTVSKSIADPMKSTLISGELPPGLDLVDIWDDSEFGGLNIRLAGTPDTTGYYEFEVGILDDNDEPVDLPGTLIWGITIVDMQAGTTPTFGPVTRLDGGYSFAITSHLGGLGISYSLDVLSTDGTTNPATVGIVRSGVLVTVSGLEDGESATVEITAHRYGYTDESAQLTGQALSTGTAPTLSAATRIAEGFQFTITNYDEESDYLLDVDPGSAAVSREDDLVTVSELAAASLGTATVTAQKAGYRDASASRSGTALDAGVPAVFATPAWTNDGFTVVIANWDDEVSYTPVLLSPSGHGAVVLNGDEITVSGLNPQEEATVELLVEHATRAGALSSVTWAAPPWEDGNLDGVTDYIQPWVVKVYDTAGVKIYLQTDPVSVCEISGTSLLPISSSPDGQQIAHATLVGFHIVGCAHSGFTTTVSWFFHGIDGAGLTPYKYHPTTGVFREIPDATLETVEVPAGVVAILSYPITDGGPLDVDGAADLQITDPVGLFGPAQIAATGVSNSPALAFAALLILLGVAALGTRVLSRRRWARLSH